MASVSDAEARTRWNKLQVYDRDRILKRLRDEIKYDDIGMGHTRFGNLYPKTKFAVRRYFASR